MDITILKMQLFTNLDSVGVVLDIQNSRSGNSFCFDHRLQIGHKSHVFRHVCCKHLYNVYAEI